MRITVLCWIAVVMNLQLMADPWLELAQELAQVSASSPEADKAVTRRLALVYRTLFSDEELEEVRYFVLHPKASALAEGVSRHLPEFVRHLIRDEAGIPPAMSADVKEAYDLQRRVYPGGFIAEHMVEAYRAAGAAGAAGRVPSEETLLYVEELILIRAAEEMIRPENSEVLALCREQAASMVGRALARDVPPYIPYIVTGKGERP